jgi:histidine ammonia-lyase
MITLAGNRDLAREAVEAVAWDGQRLALAPAALERVAAGRARLLQRLAELVAPVDQDRPLGEDLQTLVGVLEREELGN